MEWEGAEEHPCRPTLPPSVPTLPPSPSPSRLPENNAYSFGRTTIANLKSG